MTIAPNLIKGPCLRTTPTKVDGGVIRFIA